MYFRLPKSLTPSSYKQILIDSLAGYHLLLRDFGPYGTIFMTMSVHYFFYFPVILDGQFTSLHLIDD
jgi:hypothetical protein